MALTPDIHCHKCGSTNLTVNVAVEINVPIAYFHRLSKTAIGRGETRILNTWWNESDILCMDCGYSTLNEKTDTEPVETANIRVGDTKISDIEPEQKAKLKWTYHGKKL